MSEEPREAAGERLSEEELRERLEEQVRKLRVQDLLLEMAVSVLNLAARRIAKEDERDLEQARLGIDAVRAIVDMLDPDAAKSVREGLSQVQLRYAQAARGGSDREGARPAGEGEAAASEERRRPSGGPSRLWTPPGSV